MAGQKHPAAVRAVRGYGPVRRRALRSCWPGEEKPLAARLSGVEVSLSSAIKCLPLSPMNYRITGKQSIVVWRRQFFWSMSLSTPSTALLWPAQQLSFFHSRFCPTWHSLEWVTLIVILILAYWGFWQVLKHISPVLANAHGFLEMSLSHCKV